MLLVNDILLAKNDPTKYHFMGNGPISEITWRNKIETLGLYYLTNPN